MESSANQVHSRGKDIPYFDMMYQEFAITMKPDSEMALGAMFLGMYLAMRSK